MPELKGDVRLLKGRDTVPRLFPVPYVLLNRSEAQFDEELVQFFPWRFLREG